MVFIPSVFDSLNEDIKWHVKQCYLAEILKKKEFREQCRNYEKINHSLVMTEIIERVSFEIPEPEGYFPWLLVKQLVSGMLKAWIYSLDLSNAHVDQFLNKLRRPIEIKETWDNVKADHVTQEIENIAEVLNLEKIEHFSKDDIFQIEEHLERIHLADKDLDFPALDEKETLIAMSDDWWTTLETNLRENTSIRCPNVMGTPKRKAQFGGREDSPPDTPSKVSRRNLEHSYVGPDSNIGEPRDDDPLAAPLDPSFPSHAEESGIGPTDITDPPEVPPEGEQPPPAPPGPVAAEDQPDPAAAASADDVPLPETSAGPVPGQEPPGNVPADEPADEPVPRRNPRRDPGPPIITDAAMQRRIRNITICTVPLEERRADPRKLNNVAAILFIQPATSWHINGPKSSIADKNLPSMPKIQNDYQEFDGSFYEEAENMRSARERRFPAAEETGPPPEVDISAPNDVQPEPMEVEEPSDAPIPRNETIPEAAPPEFTETFPEAAPPEFTSHVPASPSSHSSREWIPVPERSSTTLRSSEKTVDSDSIPCEQNLLQSEFTKEKFVTTLNLIFENMEESGACIDGRPGVTFNVVMNPEICSEEVYILALNYSMELMRERRLTMKQEKPYDPVILVPSKSWPEPDEPNQI